MGKILIVEDEANIRQLVRYNLEKEGFQVMEAADGLQGLRTAQRDKPDLVLLDLMLPGMDGLEVCRTLKGAPATSALPIIMLTAKGEDVDRIIGLEVGADDYLPKPFNPRELLARISAVLRRQPSPELPGAPSREDETVVFGPFSLDLARRELSKNGEVISLTTGEFAMLKALVRHPRQPLSRDRLAELARGRDYEAFDRSLDVAISRLRKIIETDAAHPRYIQTVWGVGYVFVPDNAEG